ncbi:protein of unknown function [Ralstonia solanacearum CFBP2957]|nr:protein of unknown function [Ralstonia solanacearum CFBP2957]
MARYDWIRCEAAVVSRQVQIGMAHPAEQDVDDNVIRAGRSALESEGREPAGGR